MTKETLLGFLNRKIDVAKKNVDYWSTRYQVSTAKLDLLEGLVDELSKLETEREEKNGLCDILELVFSSSENGMLGNVIFPLSKDEVSIYKNTLRIEELSSIIYSFINCRFTKSIKDHLTLSLYVNNVLIQTYDCSSPQDEEDIYNFLYNIFVNKGEQE